MIVFPTAGMGFGRILSSADAAAQVLGHVKAVSVLSSPVRRLVMLGKYLLAFLE